MALRTDHDIRFLPIHDLEKGSKLLGMQIHVSVEKGDAIAVGVARPAHQGVTFTAILVVTHDADMLGIGAPSTGGMHVRIVGTPVVYDDDLKVIAQ